MSDPGSGFRKRRRTEDRTAWNRPDSRCIGVPAVAPVIVGESPFATVALTSLDVFPSGLELRLLVELLRSPDESDDDWRAWEDRLRRQVGSDVDPSTAFQMTLMVDDAYTVSSDQQIPPRPLDYLPMDPILVQLPDRGRSGNARVQSMELRMWAYPRPPSGEVTVLLEWPQLGITDQRSRLGHVDIDRLASRVLRLRPELTSLDP